MTINISKRRTTKAKLMSTNTLYLLIATASVVSAFNCNTSTASVRTSLRSYSTGTYRSRARSSPSIALSLRKTSIRTRLQFSDDTSSSVTIDSGWWRKLFTVSSRLQNRSTITSSSPDRSVASESEEQENVDTYLEFLDKRYRRLHCDDTKEEKAMSKQRDPSSSKNYKPFSTMDWLITGGNNNTNVMTTSREQQADALYVLGVAGLASQKLLQKHHLPTTITFCDQSREVSSDISSTEAPAQDLEKAQELNDKIDTNSIKIKMNEKFEKIFLLPIIRAIYLARRQKQLILKMLQQHITESASKMTGALSIAISRGPKSILNAMLGIGGGRQNIMRTIAIGYATIVIFRPLLQAVFAEGLAFDPLIQ